MRRRTLDLVFSVGGLALAVLLGVLGLVLQNQADFARRYVHDQLSEQKIVFAPVERLSDQQRSTTCLRANAGKRLTTGKQAECYANEYIADDLTRINGGKTYAETSNESRAAKVVADSAIASGSPDATQLRSAAAALDVKTQTLFRGETLRGLLLTSYGFSIFGERAQQAAWVAFMAALILALASIAGFVHAFTTPENERVRL